MLLALKDEGECRYNFLYADSMGINMELLPMLAGAYSCVLVSVVCIGLRSHCSIPVSGTVVCCSTCAVSQLSYIYNDVGECLQQCHWVRFRLIVQSVRCRILHIQGWGCREDFHCPVSRTVWEGRVEIIACRCSRPTVRAASA
jgi:hypothetical protein